MEQYLKTIGRLEPSYVIKRVSSAEPNRLKLIQESHKTILDRSVISFISLLKRKWQFLDAQRINQLTAYLQELHKQGLASEDHTTLLLNCYTKLKDTERLDQFLNVSATKNSVVTFWWPVSHRSVGVLVNQ